MTKDATHEACLMTVIYMPLRLWIIPRLLTDGTTRVLKVKYFFVLTSRDVVLTLQVLRRASLSNSRRKSLTLLSVLSVVALVVDPSSLFS